MIPDLRSQFNSSFTSQKYRRFLQRLDERCGTAVKFRNAETPCFFPKTLLDQLATCGVELIGQLIGNSDYMRASNRSIPPEFNVPGEPPHPLFIQVDFGLVRKSGTVEPCLVEIQGFPSLYAYQPVLAQLYQEVYDLDPALKFLLGGLSLDTYRDLLRKAILGNHDPENVILLEIEPLLQKTLGDFLLTERLCGVKSVCISELLREGNRLFYKLNGKLTPVRRIYNRAIADELLRKGIRPCFEFREQMEVEWAGHPNWFFRMSKFSLPYLHHPCVPKTWFLDQMESLPSNSEDYVLKPLYSFAGLGVIVGPTPDELREIALREASNYILQERVDFEPVIETPFGSTKAEIRVMYIWLNELLPVTTIVRMGRGKMMGVDHNRDLEWVGASAGLYPAY